MEHRDPEERFLLVKGTIDDRLYTFISYYAPNRGQTQFFQRMFNTLGPLTEGVIIMGGDFNTAFDSNTAFDTGLDKSKPLTAQLVRPSKASIQIAQLIFQSGMTDIWKELNPSAQDYTHFSNPHQSYSRIDHILLSNRHKPLALTSSILEVAWSDHSRVLMAKRGDTRKQHTSHWTLNQSILKDPIRVTEIQGALREYFRLNDMGDVSAETLWAAHKVTSRGKLIQIAAQRKRERAIDIESLKSDPTKVPSSTLDAARVALNLALTAKADKSIGLTGAKFYQKKDKIVPQVSFPHPTQN